MALTNLSASKVSAKKAASDKPKKALNFGSMMEVYDAVLAGHRVYSVNVNFSKGVTFGPGSALKFIGGAFTATTANEGERAFMKFMPMGYTLDKTSGAKKFISEGTTTMFKLVEEPNDMDELLELQAHLANLKDEVRIKQLESLVVSEDINFDVWQDFVANNLGASEENANLEPAFEFNLAHWDRAFVQQLGAKTAAAQVKSLSVFFVLSTNPNGTAKCSDVVPVHKPYLGEPVMGRFFETTVVAALWNESVIYTSRYKNEISTASIAESFDAALAMQKRINASKTLTTKSTNAFGNKAVANAKAAFEAELSLGKWNKFIESNLNELAKSTQFPGWSILACKSYILDMQEKFADADLIVVDDVVNIKGMATSLKDNTALNAVKSSVETKEPVASSNEATESKKPRLSAI
jgi:hypothetical protein